MPKTDFLRNWWRGSGLRPEPNGAKPRRNMGIVGEKGHVRVPLPQGIRLLPPGGLRQTGGLPQRRYARYCSMTAASGGRFTCNCCEYSSGDCVCTFSPESVTTQLEALL